MTATGRAAWASGVLMLGSMFAGCSSPHRNLGENEAAGTSGSAGTVFATAGASGRAGSGTAGRNASGDTGGMGEGGDASSSLGDSGAAGEASATSGASTGGASTGGASDGCMKWTRSSGPEAWRRKL